MMETGDWIGVIFLFVIFITSYVAGAAHTLNHIGREYMWEDSKEDFVINLVAAVFWPITLLCTWTILLVVHLFYYWPKDLFKWWRSLPDTRKKT